MKQFKHPDTIGHLLFIGAGLAFTVNMLVIIFTNS